MQMQEDVAPPPPSHIRWMKFLSVLQLIIIGPAGKKEKRKGGGLVVCFWL